MQSRMDLNLLAALDVLLEERSVGAAADRLHLSAPAMSRTLGRIRTALDDPVLVRAGREMVPTPRALAVQAEVHELTERARALFRPAGRIDPATLTRTFTVQANEAVAAILSVPLLSRVGREAPHVTLRLIGEGPVDHDPLRKGVADLEVGVITDPAPETRVRPLLEDHFVGVVRPGHPLLAGKITLARFAAADHLIVSRRGRLQGPIDALLNERGLARRVVATVPTHTMSLFLTADTDLVGMVGRRLAAPFVERIGLVTFEIPLPLEPLRVQQAWHARFDADGAHQWLRQVVREELAAATRSSG
jgi:DNA-binding transcriptional LysR family regulator